MNGYFILASWVPNNTHSYSQGNYSSVPNVIQGYDQIMVYTPINHININLKPKSASMPTCHEKRNLNFKICL